MFPRDLGVAALALVFATSTACVVQGAVSDPEPLDNGSQSPMGGVAPTGTDFGIIATAFTPNVWAGTRLNFKVVVTNVGPEEGSANVEIVLDPNLELDVWTCTASAGSSCPNPGPGSDPAELAAIPVELGAVDGQADIVVDAWVASSAVDPLTVTVRVSGEDDSNATNNEHTATKEIMQSVLLQVSKSDGQTSAGGGSVLVYEIVVENWGPSDSPAVTVTDDVSTLPFTYVEWDCDGLDGATCGTEGGTGNLGDVGVIPYAGSLVYTVYGYLDACFTGTVTNEAHASAANLDEVQSVLSATDTTNVPTVGDECAPDPCDCECDDGHDNGHNGEGHDGNGNGAGPGHSNHDDDGDGDDDHRGKGHHSCDCECEDDEQEDE